MAASSDYHYASDKKNHTHAYLEGPVLGFLDPAVNRKILDIGCGNGWLTRLLIDRGFDVYGIDASVKGIQIARQKHPDRFFLQDVSEEELPEPMRSIPFDTIISTEVIEHLYAPSSFLAFCHRILEKHGGGELILTTPYHGYWKNLALALSGKMDAHFTVLWEGGHIKFFSKKTLDQALQKAGFEMTQFKGCGRFPLFWKSMLVKAEWRK